MMVDAPAAPPLAISAPSSASDRDLHNKVDTLPLIHSRALLEICEVLHTSGEGTLAGHEFVRILRLVEGCNSDGKRFEPQIMSGLFQSQYAVRRTEQFYTSVVAMGLPNVMPRVGGRLACWGHQVPDRGGGEVDICLYALLTDDPSVWTPVCVLEFGLRVDKKHVQTLAYCVNLSPQLLAGQVLLAAEVILRPADKLCDIGWLRLTGVCIARAGCIGSTLLWEGPLNEQSASRMFAAANRVAAQMSVQQQPGSWHVSGNAALTDGLVWKAYDYRGRTVPWPTFKTVWWCARALTWW
jgi:hypothetical protein